MNPWGSETGRSTNPGGVARKFDAYTRDLNQSDEAMHRRYNRWWSRFDQPDPYDGSYDLTNPQSLNRYSYVQNDPVNFTDPTGLYGEPGHIYESVTVTASPLDRVSGGGGGGIGRRMELAADEILVEGVEGGGGGGEPPQTGRRDLEGVPLSPCVKAVLSEFFPLRLLNRIRLRDGLPWYVRANLLLSANAYTSNYSVYLRPSVFRSDTIARSLFGLAVIAHEVVHARQYEEHKDLTFKALYLASGALSLTNPTTAGNTQRFNPFEVEAERREGEIREALERRYQGQSPCDR